MHLETLTLNKIANSEPSFHTSFSYMTISSQMKNGQEEKEIDPSHMEKGSREAERAGKGNAFASHCRRH